MKTRPIIFNAFSVKAILADRKTQTRRVIANPSGEPTYFFVDTSRRYPYHYRRKDAIWESFKTVHDLAAHRSPYGNAGDLLYVRESCRAEELEDGTDGVRYLADDTFVPIDNTLDAADRWLDLYHYDHKRRGCGAKVPAIHAPKWTARITLQILDVRVERVQSLVDADAVAEGIPINSVRSETLAFASLWDEINADRGFDWEANPWVWVIECETVPDHDVDYWKANQMLGIALDAFSDARRAIVTTEANGVQMPSDMMFKVDALMALCNEARTACQQELEHAND